MREIYINGFKYYIDIEKRLLYEHNEPINPISIYSNHITKNERQQILNYIYYGEQ